MPTTPEVECSSQCSVSDTMLLLLLSKSPQRRQSGAVAHDFWLTPPQRKSPGGISEAVRYGIVSPSGLRPRLNGYVAKARRRCRNALKDNRLWRFADEERRTTKPGNKIAQCTSRRNKYAGKPTDKSSLKGYQSTVNLQLKRNHRLSATAI